MRYFVKKQTVAGWLTLASFLLGLISFLIYLINATTGYFADGGVDGWVLTFYLLYIVAAVAFVLFAGKSKWLDSGFYLLIAIFLVLAMCFTISQRAEPIGDMLVPVNHPSGEIKAVKWVLTAIILNGVSFLVLTIASFFTSPIKEGEPVEAK